MKKLFLLLGVLLSIPIQLSAAKEDVPLTIAKKGQGNKLTTVKRSPMHVSVEVIYDTASHTIEVSSEEAVDAQVYVRTEEGDVLGYSNCLNATLNIPSDYLGLLTVSIEGNEWIAEGEIEIRY